ncbi:hypothetical protein Q3G72_028100 [Acer saccharum]|nr:hypothetical protein Q3G72_028100 [Acer saccharum]
MKRFEEMDDCFILDFNPYIDSINLHDHQNNTHVDGGRDGDDNKEVIRVIAEKGPVVCRDYPHPRNLCYKFPFDTTLHSDHCEQCYCYVCDTVAPCKFWGVDECKEAHCNALEDYTCYWRNQKNLIKQRNSDSVGPTDFDSFYCEME